MNNLGDNDLPMGRGPPKSHPKRLQLTRLINQHAPEYARAPKLEGYHDAELGCFIRSKQVIITSVIEELMPITDNGRFRIKKKGAGFGSRSIQQPDQTLDER